MEDRYLFRGKRIDNGEWVQGFLSVHTFIPSEEEFEKSGKRMENRNINILGTEWEIIVCKEEESELLNGKYRDGCTDNSTKTIWICEKKDDCELQDYEAWKRLTLRHEILHAFLFESGLDASSSSMNGAWAVNEEMVDWFAIQSPKIFKVYSELGILDTPIPSVKSYASDFAVRVFR